MREAGGSREGRRQKLEGRSKRTRLPCLFFNSAFFLLTSAFAPDARILLSL
jgi:hypothetical protein